MSFSLSDAAILLNETEWHVNPHDLLQKDENILSGAE